MVEYQQNLWNPENVVIISQPKKILVNLKDA